MTTQHDANATITGGEREEIDAANASARQPVVFVHGLWLLASGWARRADLFRGAGFATLQSGWPDDPGTVEQANADPDVFANKKIGSVRRHRRWPEHQAGDHRALLRRASGPDPRRTWPVRGDRRSRTPV